MRRIKQDDNDQFGTDIEDFVYQSTLLGKNYWGREERVNLEDQPRKVCELIGRLMKVLLQTGLINSGELAEILRVDRVEFIKDE